MGRLSDARRKARTQRAGDEPAGEKAEVTRVPEEGAVREEEKATEVPEEEPVEAPTTLPASGLAADILGRLDEPSEAMPQEEKTEGPAESPEPDRPEETVMKYVTFFLGGEEYGLPISQVQEINRLGEITRVPNSPSHVMGVINLRGRIIPVIELKSRLELGETERDKANRIVVIDHGARVLGLMVERVAQVLDIASGQIEEAPEEVLQQKKNYVRAVGKLGDRMVILLDLEKVIRR